MRSKLTKESQEKTQNKQASKILNERCGNEQYHKQREGYNIRSCPPNARYSVNDSAFLCFWRWQMKTHSLNGENNSVPIPSDFS